MNRKKQLYIVSTLFGICLTLIPFSILIHNLTYLKQELDRGTCTVINTNSVKGDDTFTLYMDIITPKNETGITYEIYEDSKDLVIREKELDEVSEFTCFLYDVDYYSEYQVSRFIEDIKSRNTSLIILYTSLSLLICVSCSCFCYFKCLDKYL